MNYLNKTFRSPANNNAYRDNWDSVFGKECNDCIRCARGDSPFQRRMFLCPVCGNKRCPKATFHEEPCSGSNEPGQPGSDY